MIPQYEATLIATENIPLVFPFVKERLEQALGFAQEEQNIGHVEQALLAGRCQLWLGTEGPTLKMVGVTRIVTYPDRTRLLIELLQGADLDGFMHYLELLENWALQFNATETMVCGREGFRKRLKKIGFRKAYEVLLRPIKKGIN